jgi:hypothetical protein
MLLKTCQHSDSTIFSLITNLGPGQIQRGIDGNLVVKDL